MIENEKILKIASLARLKISDKSINILGNISRITKKIKGAGKARSRFEKT